MKEAGNFNGRFCALTEETCTLEACEFGCDGINVATDLKELMEMLDVKEFAGVYDKLAQDFPQDTQVAIIQSLNPQRGLNVFEKFFEEKK